MKIIQLSNAALTSLIDHLTDFKGDDIIIGGDYNLVLDLDKDKTGGLAKTHKNSVKIITNFLRNYILILVVETASSKATLLTTRFLFSKPKHG